MGEQCAHSDSKVSPHGESLGIPGLCSVLELCWRSRRHGEVIRLWADITVCWLAQMVLPVLLRKALHETSAAVLAFCGRGRAKLTRRSWRLVWGSGAEVTAVRRPRSGTDCHVNTHLSEPRIRENDVRSCTFRLELRLQRVSRDAVIAALTLSDLHDAVTTDVFVVVGPEEVTASIDCRIILQATLTLLWTHFPWYDAHVDLVLRGENEIAVGLRRGARSLLVGV